MTDLASKKCVIISFQPKWASFVCQFEGVIPLGGESPQRA